MYTGLVLEGGGTRGIYTSGVLEVLHHCGITIDYVIGTSMGACNGATYISNQPKRNEKIFLKYFNDKRYFNALNAFKKDKTILGMDFLFEKIPNQLVPFDYNAFLNSATEFTAVTTDMLTGKACYYNRKDLKDKKDVELLLKATSSVPLVANPVEFKGRLFVDGGIADSIPIKKALDDRIDRLIVVLTRDATYRKEPAPLKTIYSRTYKDYPNLIDAINKRHLEYNQTVDFINHLENRKEIIVIRPSRPISVDHLRTTKEDLDNILNLGIKDAFNSLNAIKEYLH